MLQDNDQHNSLHHHEPLIHIGQHVSLANKNWFSTGGCARYFAQPQTSEQFQHAIAYAQHNGLSTFLLGSGANILISDGGFNGLVIQPQPDEIVYEHIKDNTVHVMTSAGTTMDELIEWCLDHNIIGLEEFSGIPGTVGGSVYINIHYFKFLLGQFLVRGEIIHKKTGEVHTVNNEWFKFGYDTSSLHTEPYYLASATFELKTTTDHEIAYARGRRIEIIRHRKNRYPYQNTCGSFFKNCDDDQVTLEINGRKMIYAAYYLDKLGVKGELAVGNARVSHQHANMLITLPGATSADVVGLARKLQQRVYDQFGVLLQPECQLIGFDPYPLLTSST